MMFTKTFGMAAVFAALASALPSGTVPVIKRDTQAAGGSVLITNNLDKDVYAWSVTDNVGPMQTLKANGGTYTEQWKTNPNGGGVSIKLATDESQSDVLQFEYTQATDTIFWDLSCIDMGTSSEFTQYGFAVQPSDSGSDQTSCPTAICKAGDSNCAAAYLQPTDDHATHGCPIDTGLSVTLGQ
ncbi:Secreted thaumatin-like protein cetA [Penicillium angulare]|uniref:Secreted thaumatin-like protein cetA n=1 Tax=Penicillium angulare TaxID=116970 RepID=A0A9W9K6Y4_9EURO|nr:Secreted thaumatin-like protein cetA [Penicillium angulare]